VPLILVGSSYWGGLLTWMKETMLHKYGNISPHNLELLQIADTADEVARHILDFYSRNALQPNF
jgi:predicted Rossmann-fold nucleotide-binding protein